MFSLVWLPGQCVDINCERNEIPYGNRWSGLEPWLNLKKVQLVSQKWRFPLSTWVSTHARKRDFPSDSIGNLCAIPALGSVWIHLEHNYDVGQAPTGKNLPFFGQKYGSCRNLGDVGTTLSGPT